MPIGFDYGTGEGASLCCIDSFNEIGNAIRQLKNLPLTVNSVQGISPVLRYTDVIPPLSRTYMHNNKIQTNTRGSCVLPPPEAEMQARPGYITGYVKPIEGMCSSLQ